MNCKEHLLYFFLQGKISLSQYDYKFMTNLQMMISNTHRITSNQATLFDNLISKYKKQLTKAGHVKEELKLLPWNADLVESTVEYTGAFMSVVDDELQIRVPFNKAFISQFRDIPNNTFEWIKDSKVYKAPFSTTAFKIAHKSLPKYFNDVSYSDDLSAILDQLSYYDSATVWEPTLIDHNGHLFIAASNPIIHDLIQDIDLQINMKTLHLLSQYGIKVDSKITDNHPEFKFASEYITEVDLNDMGLVAKWLVDIGCNKVTLGRGISSYGSNRSIREIVIDKLHEHNISNINPNDLYLSENPVLIQHSTQSIGVDPYIPYITKCIILKDSRPIAIR